MNAPRSVLFALAALVAVGFVPRQAQQPTDSPEALRSNR